MRPPGGGDGMHHEDRDHDEGQALATPARLDKMLAHLDEMRARLATHAAAVKTFYAQLTPAQQKVFDDLAPMLMMHGMGGGRHGMGGDHDGMHRHHDGEGHGDGDHAMGPGGPPNG
jgi:hypothetical protein